MMNQTPFDPQFNPILLTHISVSKTQFNPENESILPPSDDVLAMLEIDDTYIESITNPDQFHTYIAIYNFIKEYQPPNKPSNLQLVQGYLEAFHHLCDLERWQDAWNLICIELNTPIQDELHSQLQTWSFYKEKIELYERLLGKLSIREDGLYLGNLGIAYKSIGEYEKALALQQQSLEIDRQIGNKQGEANSLGNLGNVYLSIGECEKALAIHQQSLEIMRQIKNRDGEAISLYNLAMTWVKLDRKWEALQAFKAARELYFAMGVVFEVQKCDENIREIGQMAVAIPMRAPRFGNEPEPDPYRDLHPKDRIKLAASDPQKAPLKSPQAPLTPQNRGDIQQKTANQPKAKPYKYFWQYIPLIGGFLPKYSGDR